jgi:hypothetical protein
MASTINATGSGIVLTGSTTAALNLLVGGSTALSIGTGATTTIANVAITTITGTSATITNLNSTSANITTLTGTNLSYGSLTLSSGANIAGNVGIGTTAPGNKFQVSGDSIRNTAQAATAAGTVDVEAQVYNYWGGTGGPTYTGTAITQAGVSATGTTCGLSNANLGTVRFQNGSAGLIYTNGGAPIVFGTTATERMRIDSSGNVGIGGTPSYRLQVIGGTSAQYRASGDNLGLLAYVNDTSNSYMRMQNTFGSTDYGQGSTASFVNVNNSQPWYVSVAAAARLWIANTGNVGIGTTTPSSTLQVNGTLTTTRIAPTFIVNKQNTTGEGGEFALEKSDTSTLSGNLVFDLIGNSLRIFEGLPSYRGAILDIGTCAAGVGSTLLTSTNYSSFITASSPIKSIQRGTGSGFSTVNITITSVNTAKASVRYLGTAPSGTAMPYWSSQGYMTLTSSTNLMVVPVPAAGPGQFYSWEVVEFV